MKHLKFIAPIAAVMLFTGHAYAQTAVRPAVLSDEEAVAREIEYTERLKEAEESMASAARLIAEITSERMPRFAAMQQRFNFSNGPRIGVTIDGVSGDEAVDGVRITGVTPGSAADDAGMRAGDMITAVNGESMSAENSNEANKRLLDFMHGVEEGDTLLVDYSRGDSQQSVEISPRAMEMHAFSWAPEFKSEAIIEKLHGMVGAPGAVNRIRMDLGFPWAGSGLGRMELVELNEGLGKYFGTDTGLLVVSAPKGEGISLLDGDVIQSIDGRTPKDVRHAMRILSSYQSGESLQLGIMRDKKKRQLEIEIPADYRSNLRPLEPGSVMPARVVTSLGSSVAGAST